MSPSRAVERLEAGIGLGGGELAGVLGTSARTVERWRSGRTCQREARERLAGLIALERHLGETFKDTEAAGSWLRAGSCSSGGSHLGGPARRPAGPGTGCARGPRLRRLRMRPPRVP